jgi:SAM-dependent methyltransferase
MLIKKRKGKEISFERLNRSFEWKREIIKDQQELAEKCFPGSVKIDRCPICDSKKYTPLVEVFRFHYCECINCGHVFCLNVPNDQALEALYTPDSDTSNAQHKVYLDEEQFKERVLQIAAPKVDFIIDVIGDTLAKDGLHWVDIGCGTGELLSDCLTRGFTVCGLELDRDQAEFARNKGVDVINDMLNEYNTSTLVPSANVVSIVNVLEHIKDPKSFMSLITKYLCFGSFVALEVPKHPSLSSINRVLFPDLAYRHVYSPDHLHIFSEQSMCRLLSESGLDLIAVWTFGQDADEFLGSILLDKGVDELSKEAEILMKLAPSLQELIDKENLSDTMFVVAKKNECNK